MEDLQQQVIVYGNEVAKKSPYDGYYVTQNGTVLSVLKRGLGKPDYTHPHVVAPLTNRTGYIRVNVNSGNGFKQVYLHKLVYETWIGPVGHNGEADSEWVIDHINGDITDNRVDNLRLLTRSQNSYIAYYRMVTRNAFNVMGKTYKVFVNDVYKGVEGASGMTHKYGINSRERHRRIATRRMVKPDGTVIRWEECCV